MLKKFFRNKWINLILIAIISLIVLACMFPSGIPIFQKLSEQTVRLILFFIFFGLFFMIMDHPRLMLVSLLAAGILSLFLKNLSNENLNYPQKHFLNDLSIAHYNLINLEGDHEDFLDDIKQLDADIISFQELTPGWSRILRKALTRKYPYFTEMVRIDAFGKLVMFKKNYFHVDTFYYDNIPNLDIGFELDESQCHFISTQIVPPYNTFRGLNSREHLEIIKNYSEKIKGPVILAGEFNQVYWSTELRSFVESSDMINSRRFISSLYTDVPHEHIFHSNEFECTKLIELTDRTGAHVGMLAEYQLRSGNLF